ncbi:uncharacterized protein EV420DRAFT_1482704 [Desarmillaria tabescens]|uniref:Uncharacterized protein n=1 Tax=Armillaria tabescens TaxID=1929756 RepID=A0AA39MY57_ARMTA|nr:uncharacterized protein EV420DRAFT_1482704 [Desarmillaria tabescens]KAK0450498.1 hypothetical protein EV420DRAFT_1482704 [Desarmillaria tabescens]
MADPNTEDFLRQILVHKLRFLVMRMLNQRNITALRYSLDVDMLIKKVQDVHVDWDSLMTPSNTATHALRTPPSTLTSLPSSSPQPPSSSAHPHQSSAHTKKSHLILSRNNCPRALSSMMSPRKHAVAGTIRIRELRCKCKKGLLRRGTSAQSPELPTPSPRLAVKFIEEHLSPPIDEPPPLPSSLLQSPLQRHSTSDHPPEPPTISPHLALPLLQPPPQPTEEPPPLSPSPPQNPLHEDALCLTQPTASPSKITLELLNISVLLHDTIFEQSNTVLQKVDNVSGPVKTPSQSPPHADEEANLPSPRRPQPTLAQNPLEQAHDNQMVRTSTGAQLFNAEAISQHDKALAVESLSVAVFGNCLQLLLPIMPSLPQEVHECVYINTRFVLQEVLQVWAAPMPGSTSISPTHCRLLIPLTEAEMLVIFWQDQPIMASKWSQA